jgi:GT2 family glycosyltransferase
LSSLVSSAYFNYGIIVLDNNSTDGSVPAIRSAFPAVQIIGLTENLGYAGNNNVGMEAALVQGADWVFVLNEDTILDPACLAQLVEVGESDDRIGIVGPMVYHHDEPDVIQSAGGKLNRSWDSLHIAQNEPDQHQITKPHQVDFISGCGIMFRRSVLEQVGMFDKRFFYYKEETELCFRAKRAGWRIVHVPHAKLWHKGVQRDYRPKPHVTYYGTRNKFLLLAKHDAPLDVWVISLIQKLRTLVSWTVKPKWRVMRLHRNAMFRGMLDFMRHRWGQMPS